MPDKNSKIKQISARDLYKSLGKNPILIDVRTSEEYERGKIEESINIPLSELATSIHSAVPDKKSLVYLYCLSGSRSDLAAGIMQNLGYTNVFSLASGLLAWRANLYPVS